MTSEYLEIVNKLPVDDGSRLEQTVESLVKSYCMKSNLTSSQCAATMMNKQAMYYCINPTYRSEEEQEEDFFRLLEYPYQRERMISSKK